MAQELIYTSFPKGVKPGVSGFCTVAVSPDLAPNMISRLEGLSGYRHLYMPGTPEADLNPPNWSHIVISVGNAESHVVYRVADAGLDYTGRSNKLAHFIVLDKNDQAPCGPAAMLSTPGLIDLVFDQQVGTRPFNRPIPRQLVSPRPCMAWRQTAGDAGWAGELAQTAWTGKYACIVYKPGMNALALIQEAMALLPPERRWKTTFSTYYSKLPTGIDCQWRCVVAGTPEAAQAIAEVGSGLVIDLSNGALAPAPDSPAAASARAGRTVLAPSGTKTGGAAARQRTAQTAKSAVEAAVNSGIQDELNAIDSTPVNTAETDAIDAPDSALQFSVETQKRKKVRTRSGVKYGMYAAIIAGVVLLGVVVATICVVTTNSTQVSDNRVLSNQTNQDNSDEDATTDEYENQQPEPIANTDQNPASDQNEEVFPVTEPNAEPNPNPQQEEGSNDNGSGNGENEQPEQQNANTDQNPATDQNAAPVTDSNAGAVPNPKEDEEARKAELARQEEARKEKIRLQKEAENKIFNDPRWAGMDRNQYFIYVDSKKEPDYTRLDLQLQKRKSPIEKLQLISVADTEKTGMADYKLILTDDGSNAEEILYDLSNNGDYSLCKIRLIKDESKGENSDKVQRLLRIVKDGDDELNLVVTQFVFRATFANQETQIISFLCEDEVKEEKPSSKKGPASSNKGNQTVSEYIRSEFKNVTTADLVKGEKTCLNRNVLEGIDAKRYKQSKILISAYSDTIIIGNNKNSKVRKFKIIDSDLNRNDTSEYILKVKIDFPFDLEDKNESTDSEAPKKTITINNLIVKLRTDYTNNSAQLDNRYFKAKFEFDCDDDPANKENIELARDDFRWKNTRKYYEKKELSNLVKEILLNLPVRIDVYIEGRNSQLKIEPFLWKRIVLPPPPNVYNFPPGASTGGK